jgi:hypothetical protein
MPSFAEVKDCATLFGVGVGAVSRLYGVEYATDVTREPSAVFTRHPRPRCFQRAGSALAIAVGGACPDTGRCSHFPSSAVLTSSANSKGYRFPGGAGNPAVAAKVKAVPVGQGAGHGHQTSHGRALTPPAPRRLHLSPHVQDGLDFGTQRR